MEKKIRRYDIAIKSLHDAVERLSKHKEEMVERFKVKKIGIFGSLARGEHGKRSDVDMLVEYRDLPNLLELVRLERYLEGILGKKVDLVEKRGLRKEIKRYMRDEIIYI
ncbi:MAG: nucleotidyltransferase family protein [Deltaproteobacteria bacterium]|nr:nucleotidyltransferase family protein [Deltaproteobacteria bacterium]